MHDVLLVYKQVELMFDEDGNVVWPNAEPKTITISYDEKPRIQAIANVADDLLPTLQHGFIGLDSEYKRLSTIFFAGWHRPSHWRDNSPDQLLYITDSKLTPRHFYNGLLAQLGQEGAFCRGDARRKLHNEIEVIRGMRKLLLVVVVDEAHLLDREMLEEVRFLLNFKMDAMSPLTLILVGQSELWNRLDLKSFTAIRQRIDLRCRLSSLDRAETGGFITRQLQYAGVHKDIFTEAAMNEIYNFSSGSPRLINKLCTNCLIYGATMKHRLIDDHMVRLVVDGEMS